MTELVREFLLALRRIARRPTSTVLPAATLAVGLGSGLATLIIASAVFLEPLPFTDSGRLAFVLSDMSRAGGGMSMVSPLNLEDWRADSQHLFEGLEGVADSRSATLGGVDRPRHLTAEYVTPAYFDLLGVGLLVGSGFEEGSRLEIILSESLWTNQFQRRGDILGQSLRLDGRLFEVVGVMPSQYEGIWWDKTDIWLPLASAEMLLGSRYLTDRSLRWHLSVGRLKPGVSADSAQEEMNHLTERLEEQYPVANKDVRVLVIPLSELYFADTLRRGLIFLALGGLFLVAMCVVNVASLELGYVLSRVREIAIRRAVGASPLQALRSFALHSLLVTVAGAGGAVLLAPALLDRLLPLSEIPPASFRQEWWSPETALAALLIASAAGTAIALTPLLRLRRSQLSPSLIGSPFGAHRHRGRAFVAVVQIALSASLLLGAGLMSRSLRQLGATYAGFDLRRLGVLRLDLPAEGDDMSAAVNFEQELVQLSGSSSGLSEVTVSGPQLAPLALRSVTLIPEGAGDERESGVVYRHAVGPDHFSILGIPVLEGRDILEQDREDSANVIVVSESVAERFWPEGAIGQRLRLSPELPGNPLWTVVGVVGDVRARGLKGLGEADYDIYLPFPQAPERAFYLLFRSEADPKSLEPELHSIVNRLDPELALHPVETMRERYAERAADERFATVLTSSFSLIALLLAAVGIHGVVSLGVSQRTQELGLRLALGARPGSLLWMVLRQSLVMVAIGLVIGVALALALYRFIQGFLFGVGPFDPPTLIGVVTILVVVAIASAIGPAIRAMRIDPAMAMRVEG